jgi:glycosyltransferase involved in cell wall biosynthesis
VVRNFQFCLNQAKGDWFVMLGEDDLLHPSYLETLITSAIDNPKLAFIQPGVRVIDSEGQQIKTMTDTIKSLIKFLFLFSCSITSLRKRQVVISNGSRAIPWLFVGNFFYFPTIFWNTKIVRKFGFSDSYGITLDLEMILRILFHENGFLYCRDHLAQYRRHPSSVSNNPLNWYDRLNEEKKMIGGFINENEINAFNAFLGKLRISGRAHSLIRCIVELLRLNISLALKFFKLTFS